MASEITDLIKGYSLENIIAWCRDVVLFFKTPRKFLQQLSARPNPDLARQYIFYFIVYASSFLFVSTKIPFSELWQPALLNLNSCIPLVVVFSLACKIASSKFQFKKVLLFVLSITFFMAPLVLGLFGLFVNQEDYAFLLIMRIAVAVVGLFMVLGFGFIIFENRWIAIKCLLFGYLFINAVDLLLMRINFDEYRGRQSITEIDPIRAEYVRMVSAFRQKEKVPQLRLYFVHNETVRTIFATSELINGHIAATTNSVAMETYRTDMTANATNLQKVISALRFHRNTEIASEWLAFFQTAQEAAAFSPKKADLNSIDDLTFMYKDTTGVEAYYSRVPDSALLAYQFHLKRYHNNILKASSISNIPTDIARTLTFLPAELLDQMLAHAFNEDKPRPYVERFNDLE